MPLVRQDHRVQPKPEEIHLTSADGLDLVADRYPGVDGARRPVLLVHGLGSDARTNWLHAGWAKSLAARQLIAPDLRGHGRSGSPGEPNRYRIDAMSADIRRLLGHLGLREVDAVGYSLGARLLMTLLADGLPIRRLVLGGSAGQPQFQGLDLDGIDRFAAGGVAPEDPESARVGRVATALPSNDPLALAAVIRGLATDPATALPAPPPVVPTLLAVGSEDQLYPSAQQWVSQLPDAVFLGLPGRTHVSAVPAGRFRAAAVRWLDAAGERSADV